MRKEDEGKCSADGVEDNMNGATGRMSRKRLALLSQEALRLEERFIELTDFIPIVADMEDDRYRVASPRTAAFGWDCVSWVETLMQVILEDSVFDNVLGISKMRKKPNVDIYRDVIESKWTFSGMSLRLLYPENVEVFPFRSWANGKNPGWFQVYSKDKHYRFKLADRFTLKDSLESFVAMALVLNVPVIQRATNVSLYFSGVRSRILEGIGYPSPSV